MPGYPGSGKSGFEKPCAAAGHITSFLGGCIKAYAGRGTTMHMNTATENVIRSKIAKHMRSIAKLEATLAGGLRLYEFEDRLTVRATDIYGYVGAAGGLDLDGDDFAETPQITGYAVSNPDGYEEHESENLVKAYAYLDSADGEDSWMIGTAHSDVDISRAPTPSAGGCKEGVQVIPTSPKAVVIIYNQVKDLLAANGGKILAAQGELIGRSERSMRAYGDLSDLTYARRIPADDLGRLMRHAIDPEIGRIADVLDAYGISGERELLTGGRRDDAWDLRERWRETEPKALALHTRVDLADMTDLCPYVQIRCGIHIQLGDGRRRPPSSRISSSAQGSTRRNQQPGRRKGCRHDDDNSHDRRRRPPREAHADPAYADRSRQCRRWRFDHAPASRHGIEWQSGYVLPAEPKTVSPTASRRPEPGALATKL